MDVSALTELKLDRAVSGLAKAKLAIAILLFGRYAWS